MAKMKGPTHPLALVQGQRHQLGEHFADPDLVDLIFELLVAQFPEIAKRQSELKADVRAEFAGIEHYVAKRPKTERERRVAEVLSHFNGRNATELARRLKISRATVYRIIKQPAKAAEGA